jgi:pyruvate-formate lyase
MQQGLDIHADQGKFKDDISVGNVFAIGFGTAIDSLAAIKKLVYDDRVVSMGELVEALDANFEGKEVVRQLCLNAPKYGNVDPYADSIGREIDRVMYDCAGRYRNPWGGHDDVTYLPVTSHVGFGGAVGATPNGRNAGEALSEGVSPTQGCDIKGPTATLLSIDSTKNAGYKCRASRLLNLKFSPQILEGEEGTQRLEQFIRAWCDMKFWHIQFNVINKDILVEAQKHPEKYRNLLVRVAGYSAYFVDLSPELQNEIIARTEHRDVM